MRINGKMWIGFLAVLAALVLLAAPARAQKTTGTILGTVMDPSGGSVAGAHVSAKNTATSFERSATTDSSGYYRIDLLPAGSYTVSVEKAGFKRQVLTGITLQMDQDARIDVSMQLGEVTQQIEVTSAPPLADTTTATIGDVIENRRITTLPLNGRNFQQLALLTAGTASGQQGGTQDFFGTAAGSIGFVVNGGRDDQNNFLVDGINVIDHYFNSLTLTPSIDAIQEFKVLQNSYSAEAGMFGSGQVNITTKSGANEVHGSAFEFLRNHNLDAKNFFDLPNRGKPAFHQNSFGFSLGGPVKKDKTFWFVAYEGLRVRQGQTVLSSLPTFDQLNGLFVGTLHDPLCGELFSSPYICSTGPGDTTHFQGIGPAGCGTVANVPDCTATQIPLSRFGPVANAIIAKAFNTPNLFPNTPGLNNVSVDKRLEDRDQFVGRFDHRINDNHSLFARYIWARSDQSFPFGDNILTFDPAPPPGFPTPVPDKSQNMALGLTSSLRPNLLNELRIGWNYYNGKRTAGNNVNLARDILGLPAGPTTNIAPSDLGFPAFHVAGLSQFGDSDVFNPLFRKDRVLQISDNLIWSKGRHSLKFGGDIRDVRFDTLSNFFTRGFPNFDGFSLTGSFVADFMMDRPFFNVRTIGDTTGNFVTHLWGMYVNDEWRATSRLTMTLGLRYEIFPPIYEKNNRLAVYDSVTESIIIPGSTLPASADCTNPDTLAGQYSSLTGFCNYQTGDSLGLGRSITKTDFKRIAPRLGLAYDLTGKGKTVIRAAFGLFNALRDYSASSDSRNMLPFALQMTLVDLNRIPGLSFLPPLGYDTMYQGYFNPAALPVGNVPGGGIGPQVNMPIGYTEQYTVNIQHQIGQNFSIEAAYVGVTGINLNRLTSTNQIHLTGPNIGSSDNPQFGTFIQEASGATSSYHGGFVRAEKRMSQGLAFVASYTYSKSIDTVSSARENGGAPTREQDSFCLKCDRGLSNFDIRNRFVASFTYELPFGPGHTYMHDVSGALAKLAGGWQVGGIVTLQGGQPFTPQYPGGSATIRFPRPSQDGNGNLPAGQRDPAQWFNTAVYFAPAPILPGSSEAAPGNSGRNSLIGPGYKDVDFTLQKDTAINERYKLQFRAELFNLFNHPNFNLPDRVFVPGPTGRNVNPNFGQITSARLPRVVQFGLKFTF